MGIRSYARGRAYDPYRYSPDGPTLYKDPGAPIDENAVEAALEKNRTSCKRRLWRPPPMR